MIAAHTETDTCRQTDKGKQNRHTWEDRQDTGIHRHTHAGRHVLDTYNSPGVPLNY